MKNGFQICYEAAQRVDSINKAIRVGLGLPPFEEVSRDMGGIHIFGRGENGLPYALQNLTRNILVIGDPGSGKTTANANLIINGLGEAKAIAQEYVKHDYRHILRYSEKTIVLSFELGTYKDNPLQPPPGVTDDEWDPIVTEAYSQPFKMPGGAGGEQYFYLCLKEIRNLARPRIPTFADLYEYMKEKNEPRYTEKARYAERNLVRLSSLNYDLGKNCNVSEGYPIDYLVDGDFNLAVIELPSKSDMAGFAGDVQTSKILKYRMKLPPERRQRVILLVIDECKKQFGVHREGVRFTGNISNMSLLVSSAREFNVGFLFSDQSITALHPILFELCDTFILFKSNAETIYRMSNIIGLNHEQRQWLIEHNLEVGQCLVKSGNWPPVLLRIPHFIYEKNVTDEEILF